MGGGGLETDNVSEKRAFTTWQRLSLLLLAVLGFAQVGYWAVVADHIEKPLDTVCASWDHEASTRVAQLVGDPSTLGESRLDDALYRLRRARQNCRAGWHDVARQDYAALRDVLATDRPVASGFARRQ